MATTIPSWLLAYLHLFYISSAYTIVKTISSTHYTLYQMQDTHWVTTTEGYCNSFLSTTLASIHNDTQNTEAYQLCSQNTNGDTCYIGLNDIDYDRGTNRDGWVWWDQSEYDYMNWAPTEPSGGSEDCVEIYSSSAYWNDRTCEGGNPQRNFLCNNPTTSPTASPSQSPSNPSIPPSRHPSQSPSGHPTVSPTLNPTRIPTQAPTTLPSLSPTECVDFYDYNSLDGQNEIVNNVHSEKYYPVNYNGSESSDQQFIAINKSLSSMDIVCNNSILNDCFIGCYFYKGCQDTIVTIISHSAADNNVFILCNSRSACDGMKVNINSIIDATQLSIDCNSSYSCQDLSIDSTPNNDQYTLTVNISCYFDYSCNNLVINSDNSKKILITLHSFKYSENVNIYHHYLENINIKCGSDNDHRYIEYAVRGNDVPDSEQVLALARNEYPSTQRLPCEDINIECSNNTDFPMSCQYQYDFVDNVSLSAILEDNDRPNCYWLDINQLYLASCQGNCGDLNTYYSYPQIIELNMTFSVEQNMNQTSESETESYEICDAYFGTNNNTMDSLDSIDAVFGSLLSNMQSIDGIIHKVSELPLTKLMNDINCTQFVNVNTIYVPITTNFTIESASGENSKVSALFDENSQFINTSKQLLSEIFGLKVNYVNVTNTINSIVTENTVTHDISLVIGIVFVSCVVVIVIVGVVFYKSKRRKRKLEALTQFMTNPMLISIAIGQYDSNPSKESVKSVGGYFSNLDGIDQDIINIIRLFDHTFNYEIFPKYDITGYIKQRWSQSEIMDLLQKQAEMLENNVYESDNHRTKKGYDGLVVFISCHGIKDHVVSSDYGKIDKSAIHRIFSKDHPKSRSIPRVFVFDCCDGIEERDTDWRDSIGFDQESSSEDEEEEKGKALDIKNIEPNLDKNMTVKSPEGGWYYGEDNPDHKLAVIHASNQGFQSKMSSESGSYVITKLVEKIRANYESTKKPNKKFLYQIMDEIQYELESSGKQLPVHTYYNGTGYIKFKKYMEPKQSILDALVGKREIEMNKTGDSYVLLEDDEMEVIKDQRSKPSVTTPS